MHSLVRRIPFPAGREEDSEAVVGREWLVTNGLGGYASGTISGVDTRRYHGLLIAALPNPYGRIVMLNHLEEGLRLSDGTEVRLGGVEKAGPGLEIPGASYLTEFRMEAGLPVWRYQLNGMVVEKRLIMPHEQNTVYLTYRLLHGNESVRLEIRPSVHFRPHEAPVNQHLGGPYVLTAREGLYELSTGAQLPPLRMMLHGEGGSFTVDGREVPQMVYRIEESRGYESVGSLWSPGYFAVDLPIGGMAALVASTDSWEVVRTLPPDEALAAERERRRRLVAMAHPKAQAGTAAELVLAADQFIITPAGRVSDAARAHASGDEERTIIAGYHWFTDWGRDTMISLEGLALTTGREMEAGYILRTFAHYIRDGLIPNMFPEGEQQGLYHSADATLWYFHAIDRYLEATGDRETLRHLLPKLLEIVDCHLKGTRFGIGVDPKDGLVRQGQELYQLTWMDAKVGDWVVTPRRGKAVEINALWYNALRLLERWVREEMGEEAAQPLAEQAARTRISFNRRFWYEEGGYLYDVVDGEDGKDDPACRPNQLLAISLRHPVLDRVRWESVMQVVLERLVTPVGLRSLAPGEPDYKPKYYGDLRSRDAAYHQGTVWAWLIGPFIDGWLKLYPEDRVGARRYLEGFKKELEQSCVGQISEVFDAESPFTPRGCIAQAWSIAEALRCWVKTAE